LTGRKTAQHNSQLARSFPEPIPKLRRRPHGQAQSCIDEWEEPLGKIGREALPGWLTCCIQSLEPEKLNVCVCLNVARPCSNQYTRHPSLSTKLVRLTFRGSPGLNGTNSSRLAVWYPVFSREMTSSSPLRGVG
jgi:hypothetical protein